MTDVKTIVTIDTHKGEVSETVLIIQMVGRSIDNIYPQRAQREFGDVVLEARNWNAYNPALGRTVLRDIAFNVRRGEIVGFAGLMGSGRTELALSMFGNPVGFQIKGDLL